MKGKILLVGGATATGKTAFAVEMAQRLNGEVISADCMLVYRDMDIGTAKPTEKEMCGIPHYMIDIVSPDQPFSVGDYEDRALPICEDILARGKVPIVCGGTGFYMQALLFLRSNGNVGADPELRRRYEELAAREGNAALFARLAAVDPESAATLHPHDVKRVIRALEIFERTGKRKSEQNDGFCPRFPYLAVQFDYPRDVLYERIGLRVDRMISAGLIDEVRALLASGVPESAQSMQGIGYKEVLSFLNGAYLQSTMSDMIKMNTRHYAKRQITYFKKFPGMLHLYPRERSNAEKVTEMFHDDTRTN